MRTSVLALAGTLFVMAIPMSASAMPNPTQPCDQTASGPDRSVMWFATRDRGALAPRSSTDRHTSGDTCREPVDRARLTAEALRFATGGRGPIMMPAHRMAQTAPCAEAEGVGVVTSIGDGAITIQHEPIPALGWTRYDNDLSGCERRRVGRAQPWRSRSLSPANLRRSASDRPNRQAITELVTQTRRPTRASLALETPR